VGAIRSAPPEHGRGRAALIHSALPVPSRDGRPPSRYRRAEPHGRRGAALHHQCYERYDSLCAGSRPRHSDVALAILRICSTILVFHTYASNARHKPRERAHCKDDCMPLAITLGSRAHCSTRLEQQFDSASFPTVVSASTGRSLLAHSLTLVNIAQTVAANIGPG
jgi:hypothetical protein